MNVISAFVDLVTFAILLALLIFFLAEAEEQKPMRSHQSHWRRRYLVKQRRRK